MIDLRRKSGIIHLALTLCCVCAGAAALMGVTAFLTKKPILEREKLAVQEALLQVLPPFDTMTQKECVSEDGVPAEVFTAFVAGGRTAGYAVRTRTLKGYGGEVEALVGFDPDGGIRRIIVTKHNETPGLGTQVMDRKKRKSITSLFRCAPEGEGNAVPPNEALDSYAGRKPSEGSLAREDVHFVTGATISSKAMLDLVNRAGAVLRAENGKNGGGSK